MRVSLKWLAEYVDVEVDVDRLKDMLDLSGTKVEAVHRPGTDVDGIVVAEVLAIHPHPNADTLTLVDVRTSGGEQRVVCGARNFAAGDLVPLATVGSRLPGMKIEERKIRGEISRGMLCSAAELGVSRDHSGILVLPSDAPLGADVTDLLNLDDTILELEVTPNRGDCLGMIGVAREVAALLKTDLRIPDVSLDRAPDVKNDVSVVIEDPTGCPRFFAGLATDVSVAGSPMWLAARLLSAGVRPISNVVDVTNYVMLETGHPVHAYDAALVADRTFVVRRAKPGERLTTLDGVERQLDPEDLLICDPGRPLGLAGVMGGEESEVSDETHEILVEVAHFDPVAITKTSRRHNLRTEASARFEKGADPNGVEYAGHRVLQLLADLAGARVAADDVDEHPRAFEPRSLTLRTARTDRLLGFETPPDEQAALLRSVGFEVREGEILEVTAPSFRPDVEREVDLIEEVARLAGFDRLPETLPPGRAGGLTGEQQAERTIRRLLSGMGLHEAWTPSMMSSRDVDLLELPEEHPGRRLVRLANPITEAEDVMRTTLLPGLLRAVARNAAHHADAISLYEIARVYDPSDRGDLPEESLALAGAFAGARRSRSWRGEAKEWDFFTVKGILETLFASLRIPNVRFAPVKGMPFHPTRVALLSMGRNVFGMLGEVHPTVCERYGAPERTVAFEIMLAPVLAALPGRPEVEELPRFPSVYLDLAIVVDEMVTAERVGELIEKSGAPEVVSVTLFDVYRGDQVEAGKKSLAYGLELRVGDRTLTDQDAQRVRDRILVVLRERAGAELRA